MEFERKRHSQRTSLNIAPLVDVVFLLLLFFMLTSSLVRESAVRIRLPESKTASPAVETTSTVVITREGGIFFMDREVGLSGLREAVREGLAGREEDYLRIKADRDAGIGLLMRVIDEIRLAGVRNFSVVAEKRP